MNEQDVLHNPEKLKDFIIYLGEQRNIEYVVQQATIQALAAALKPFIERRQHISKPEITLSPEERKCLTDARAALAAAAPFLETK